MLNLMFIAVELNLDGVATPVLCLSRLANKTRMRIEMMVFNRMSYQLRHEVVLFKFNIVVHRGFKCW